MMEKQDDFNRKLVEQMDEEPTPSSVVSNEQKKGEVLSPEERKKDGEKILNDALHDVQIVVNFLNGALSTFYKQIHGSKHSPGLSIYLENRGKPSLPILQTGKDFSQIAEMVTEAMKAFEGKISLREGMLTTPDARAMADHELQFMHDRLELVREQAEDLRKFLIKRSQQFDKFNGENAQAEGYEEANIEFDRDGLNVSVKAAEDLAVKVVYLDIDVMQAKDELQKMMTSAHHTSNPTPAKLDEAA